MPPEHLRFGGGAADSTIVPAMALFLLIACILILVLSRQKAIAPFLIAGLVIPVNQVVVLGGLHFSPIRILVLVAMVRMIVSPGHERFAGGINRIDQMVALWSVFAVVAFFLEFPGTPAVIQGAGDLIDTLGGYLAVRYLIPDGASLRNTIKALALVCVIQGVPMIVERIAQINVFGYFAGIPVVSTIRDGKVRAAGTMGALSAGPFAGMCVPLFLWLWSKRESRTIAICGLISAMAMVITSNSSTSLSTLLGAFIALSFWRFRKQMRPFRWGVATALLSLHLLMKAPVWALIARLDFTGSSSSYQRYALIDMTIRHFSDWWLIGTNEYLNWGWDSWDTCDQFVDVALKGGLIPLIFFIATLSRSFGMIGRARKLVEGNRKEEWFLWCFGAAVFASFVSCWGINFTGILLLAFFALLALLPVAKAEALRTVRETVGSRNQERLAFAGGAKQVKSWAQAWSR